MLISTITSAFKRFKITELYVFLVLVVCLGCQNSTEPSNLVVGDGFDVTVRVHDQAGQPLAGVAVQWALLGQKQVSFATMSQAGNDGEFAATIPVPVATDSALVVIRTDIPTGIAGLEFKGNQKNGDFRLDTVRVCRDTALDIGFSRQVTVSQCGGLSCSPISLLCEFPDKIEDSACTSEYVNSTTEVLTIAPFTSSVPSVTVKVKVNGVTVSTPATIPIGARFQICYFFAPGINSPIAKDQFNANIVVSSPTNPNCLTCSFTLTTEVRRKEDCDCPLSPKPITFPIDTTKTVDVCVGKDTTVEIPIGFKNDNRAAGCDVEYTLVSPTSNNEFEILSANNGSPNTVRIAPGASFGKLKVLFSPTLIQQYKIDIRYSIKVINADGTVKQCADPLIIHFNGAGGQSTCRIDTLRSTEFLSPAKKQLDTLRNCVDVDLASNARTIVVVNTGKCDVTISAAFNNPLFTVSPKTKQIQAGDSAVFTLKFLPKPTDVWPGGRGKRPAIERFNGTLSLSGCAVQNYAIPGFADTSCYYPLNQCLHKWPEPLGNWTEVILIDRTNNSLSYSNDPKKVTSRDIFVDNINVAGQTAILNSDIARWKVVASRPSTKPGETACSFGFQFINACDASAPTGPLPVKLWDVVSFTLDYADGRQFCGIIWITDFHNDVQGANGVPQICIQICYPL